MKLWQASLIDSVPAPGDFQSPSSTSAPPSILSVNSSEPFDAEEDLNDHLSNLKLHVKHDSSGSTNRTPEAGGFVDPSDTQHIAGMGQGLDADNSLPLNSPDRLDTEGDLPKSPWRSSCATPRLQLNQTVKARDLDSGCPGSERSTRMSHNASFEHPDQGSNFHPSLEAARDCINEPDEREKAPVAGSQGFSGFEKRSLGVENIPQEKGYPDRSPKHPTGLPLDERPQGRETVNQCEVSMESRIHSGCSKSSRNSSKNKKDTQFSLLDAQEQDFKENKISAQRMLEDKDIAEASGEESSDYNRSRRRDPKRNARGRKRSKSRRSLERNKTGGVKTSCGGYSETRSNTPGSQMQEVANKLHTSLDKIDSINQNLKKYRSKYISGYASDLSEASTSMHSSHSDIYSNISKLKRDFKILQSQMLNLKSEVFHEKKSTSHRESSKPQNTQRGRRSEPMRALDHSRYLEEDTHLGVDSSMDASRSELINRTQPWMDDRMRHRTSSKLYENSLKHSHNFSSDSSLSMFDESRMDQLPKSTPKDKLKRGSSEGRAKRDPNSKKGNRNIKVEKHESFEDSGVRRQLNLSEMEVIEISSPRKENRPISTQTPSPGNAMPQNIGVQTEDRQVPSIICTPSPLPANPTGDFRTSQTQLSEVVSEAAGILNLESDMASVKHRLSTSAPVVYIQNYQ